MESIKELRKRVGKSSASHFAPRHDIIVRKLSIYLTWLLLHTRISANGVTVLQTVVGFGGGLLLMSADYIHSLAGIFLLQLGYILDCSDGEVARYRGQASVNGVFLDLIGHEIVIPMMYFGLGVGEYLRTGQEPLLLAGFLAGLFSLRFDISAMFQTVNTLLVKSDNPSYDFESLDKGNISSITTRLATSKPSLIRVLFRYPESMNVITALLLIDSFFPANSVTYFLYIYGTMIPLARIYSVYSMMKNHEVAQKYLEIIRKSRSVKD